MESKKPSPEQSSNQNNIPQVYINMYLRILMDTRNSITNFDFVWPGIMTAVRKVVQKEICEDDLEYTVQDIKNRLSSLGLNNLLKS